VETTFRNSVQKLMCTQLITRQWILILYDIWTECVMSGTYKF